MKKTLLFIIIILFILPTVVSAYNLNESYRKDTEYILSGVDCIGVDAQENIYLKTFSFGGTAILVYSKNGDFSHSITVPTSGTFYFKVDEYVWVAVVRADSLLKYSLDGQLLQATDIDEEEYRKDIAYKYVIKNGITYIVKGSLEAFFSLERARRHGRKNVYRINKAHDSKYAICTIVFRFYIFSCIWSL